MDFLILREIHAYLYLIISEQLFILDIDVGKYVM